MRNIKRTTAIFKRLSKSKKFTQDSPVSIKRLFITIHLLISMYVLWLDHYFQKRLICVLNHSRITTKVRIYKKFYPLFAKTKL